MNYSNIQKTIIRKTGIFIAAFFGILFTYFTSGFMGGKSLILYFTIQSNIWIGITCLIEAILLLLHKEIPNWLYRLKYIFTVSITLTGLIFCFILAPSSGIFYLFTISNLLCHVTVPILSLVDFFRFEKAFPYRKSDCLLCLIPFAYYLAFSSLGYILNWKFGRHNYPYFFLNWGSEAGAFGFSRKPPYVGTVWWCFIIAILVYGVAQILLLPSKKKKEA